MSYISIIISESLLHPDIGKSDFETTNQARREGKTFQTPDNYAARFCFDLRAAREARCSLRFVSLRNGTDLVSKSNIKTDINAEIFRDYIRTALSSNLVELRTFDEFTEEIIMSLMENYSSHIDNDVIDLLTETQMRLITFAPYTIQIFQVFDMTLFGVLKWHPRYELTFRDEKVTVKFIMNVFHDFKQTMVEFNIWITFQTFGFEFNT
jgi:hypothetical protein